MQVYVAFLRGINVGGKSLIKMAALKECLVAHGFADVRTYIQSGNVIFHSNSSDKHALGNKITSAIKDTFDFSTTVAIFSHDEWKEIIKSAPEWWGKDSAWKHNILIMTEGYDTKLAMAELGELKPDIEQVTPGSGVLYQSISWQYFGRGRSGKIASMPLYKKMTVRNFNTATKLLDLLA